MVTLYVRVWIETSVLLPNITYIIVTLYVRVWIETVVYPLAHRPYPGSPST